MAKQERLYSAEEGAYATRLTLSSFRAKVSKLGIKGKRQRQKVFYTHKQLEDIYNGVAANKTTSQNLSKKSVNKASKRVIKKRK